MRSGLKPAMAAAVKWDRPALQPLVMMAQGAWVISAIRRPAPSMSSSRWT